MLRSLHRLPWILTLLLAVVAPAAPARDYDVTTRKRVVLTVRPLTAASVPDRPNGAWTLEVDPDRGGSLAVELDWPDPGSRCRLRLDALEKPAASDEERLMDLTAELGLPGGRTVKAARPLSVQDTTTVLFEVYRAEGRTLTLAIEAEVLTETVLTSGRTVGPPVRLGLEIQHVDQGRAVSLETNRLDTFVGDPVSYSFRLGESIESDAVQLRLLPLRLYGELVKLEVRISGTLTGSAGTEVISRDETWIAQRGSTSTLAIEVGDPPTGYRFLITPQF